MKIAITGANGFVGSNLCRCFVEKGYEVKAIIRPGASALRIPSEAVVSPVDYAEVGSLAELFSDCEVVIHNAGKTKALNHAVMLKANVGVTENVIAAINSLASPPQLVYLSSQAAAGPSHDKTPKRESDPPNPVSSYGKSKLAAENAVAKQTLKNWTIVRPCSIYGGGDRDFLPLFKLTKAGLSLQLGFKDKYLNMIHVDELAEFLALCFVNPQAYGEVFFATDGGTYTQSQVSQTIARAMHKHPLKIAIPACLVCLVFMASGLWGRLTQREMLINREKMKEIMAPGWLASIDKAKEKLQWQPHANLAGCLKDTLECYQKLGWL